MRCLDWDSALENIRKLKAHPKECSSSAIFVFWLCCLYVYVALVVNVGCDISSWAFTKTSINSPMSYHNADASAYATLTPLQFLLTRGICWFPYAISLRKLPRLRVSLTQASYDTTPSTHIKGGFGKCSVAVVVNTECQGSSWVSIRNSSCPRCTVKGNVLLLPVALNMFNPSSNTLRGSKPKENPQRGSPKHQTLESQKANMSMDVTYLHL